MKAITFKTTNKEVNKFVKANAPLATMFQKAIIMNEKATCFEDSAFKVVEGKLVKTSPLDLECVISNEIPGDAISTFSSLATPGMVSTMSMMPYRYGILKASKTFHAQ